MTREAAKSRTLLVNWFNDVDAAYRTDLRDLNERAFARFDAKLDQRFANPMPDGSGVSLSCV